MEPETPHPGPTLAGDDRANHSALVTTTVAAAASAAVVIAFDRSPLAIAALLAAVLALFASRRPRTRAIVVGTSLGLSLAVLGGLAIEFATVLRRPPEWDFGAFWLHARLALDGIDFYDAARVGAVAESMGTGRRFVELGRFWYPPQTMLLFVPLGALSPLAAWRAWTALQIAAGAGVATLLGSLYLRTGSSPAPRAVAGAVAAAALIAWPATTATLRLGQTHFFVLLFLLLATRAGATFRSGLALGVAILWKPIAGFAALDPEARWTRRRVLGLVALGVASTALALAVFDSDVVTRYFVRGPGTVPAEVITMPQNGSLLASLTRNGWISAGADPVRSPLYLGIVAAGILGAVALLRRAQPARAAALAFLLAVGLILYPLTLEHYTVLLLPAALVLAREESLFPRLAAAALTMLDAIGRSGDPSVAAATSPVLAASTLAALGMVFVLLRSPGAGDRSDAGAISPERASASAAP
jgi:hypothetical protein